MQNQLAQEILSTTLCAFFCGRRIDKLTGLMSPCQQDVWEQKHSHSAGKEEFIVAFNRFHLAARQGFAWRGQ